MKLNEQSKIRFSKGCLINPSKVKFNEQSKIRVSKGCLINPSKVKFNEQSRIRFSKGCLINPSKVKFNEQSKIRVSKGCLINPSLVKFNEHPIMSERNSLTNYQMSHILGNVNCLCRINSTGIFKNFRVILERNKASYRQQMQF